MLITPTRAFLINPEPILTGASGRIFVGESELKCPAGRHLINPKLPKFYLGVLLGKWRRMDKVAHLRVVHGPPRDLSTPHYRVFVKLYVKENLVFYRDLKVSF